MNKTIYTYRHLANIILEASTPLAIGTGRKDIITDSLVATDVNGFPYIPGTSLAGVIRHTLEEFTDKATIDQLFGFQDTKGENDKGSCFIFSEGKLIGANGDVLDGLINVESTTFNNAYRSLPIRQHVRINHKGTGAENGKFDEQIVYKGSRFCFEIELVSDKEHDDLFDLVLNILHLGTFQLGSGTRCGFGHMKVIKCKTKHYNLNNPDDLTNYINKSSRLKIEKDWDDWKNGTLDFLEQKWIKYDIDLKAKDFFLFAGVTGDNEADMIPVKENVVEWNDNKGNISERSYFLIPATSIKGALAHRTAYYYNKANGIYADTIAPEACEAHIGSNNNAVRDLFGLAINDAIKEDGQRGNVILHDVYIQSLNEYKFNHVCIDRFTGGNMQGFLFNEKTTYTYNDENTFSMTIYVNRKVDDKSIDAFENALIDLCMGMLPLGGNVNKGHGIFNGNIKKDNCKFDLTTK